MRDEKETKGVEEWGLRKKIGFAVGPALFLLVLALHTGMPHQAQLCLAEALWIITWWITEAVPIWVTSLLPLVVTPMLGIEKPAAAAAPYADTNVILFMGGFMIAMGIVKWNLHRRLSLLIVNLVGVGPKRIILGFMVAVGVLSMWISNTAAAMAVMPIGLAVTSFVSDNIEKAGLDIPTETGRFNFGIALMLGIAYGASIGGLATPIGTPPNIIFIANLEQLYPGTEISFARWMMFGVPMIAIFIPVTWLIITAIYPPRFKEIPGGREFIKTELEKLGPWTGPEKAVMVIFGLTAFMWIIRGFILNKYFPFMDDSTIAIIGALLMFVVPISWKKGVFALDWEWAVKIPWGILLLFGGGLSLAHAIDVSGLSLWLSEILAVFGGVPHIVLILLVATFTTLLSEVTSNTATAAMLMPIMAALGAAIGVNPIAIMLAAALAASFAYMLPVATPPNAIVYGSGYLRVTDMLKAGVPVDFSQVLMGTLLIYFLAIPILTGTMI
jgi:sodium-dependent dicarboxylate transporter 2/3/5